ncbi:disease resistance protein At4g27190-like [Coffea arabica]|uniref:Disease resistance protein At4g27190-like n=1 Tax=Coffea arabica TaxID=13443 RepID=A0ABM4VQD4_COFAR
MKKVPYASAVSSLMYAMVCTRPDIADVVGVVSRYLSNPGKEHWNAVKWILRYSKGTSRLCLCFGNGKTMLDGYTDADMAGDLDNGKSTSGYLMIFVGGAVSWQSKLQKCIALSSTKAEYIAITEACKETFWLQKFLQELGMKQEKSSSRSGTVPKASQLDSSREDYISLPQGEEELRISYMVRKIIECMQDDKYRRIGIHGKDGIGQTTVLKALFCAPEIKNKFNFLIQVTISRNWSREKIQLEIARQLELTVEGPKSGDELTSKLFHALQSKKYLLILDDVWDNINLEALGVNLESHSRLVVATRSVHICKIMALDQQIEVSALPWKEAWNLFQEQVGGLIDSPNIRPRVVVIVSECDGLLLMIIVIGRALAKENDVLGWRLVLSNLSSVTELKSGDTESHDEVLLQKLTVGYDKLHDYDLKHCFLYCVLFPEDHNIQITELINYWIQEGLVTGNPVDASRKGFRIVWHLTEASLVERVDGISIKMHNLIRDLASWIILSEDGSLDFLVGRKFNKVGNQELMLGPRTRLITCSPQKLPRVEDRLLSRAGAGLPLPPTQNEWEETEMIFLMDNGISKLPKEPNCRKLKMTNIRSLPSLLYNLSGLQALILCHCPCLSEISPRVGEVKPIEILDLTGTEIYSLPDTIGKLSSLKHLHSLEELSIEVQPRDTQWNTDAEFVAEELSNLSNLDTLCICFPEIKFLKTFLGSSPAWKADNLRKFKFVIGHDIKRSTSRVPRRTEQDYDQEHKIRSLTEFGIQIIRQLKFCTVSECSDMESIVDGGSIIDEIALPNLSHLSLHYLWNLNKIWKGEITVESFKALKVLSVHTCLRLEFVLSCSMKEVCAAEIPKLKKLELRYLTQLVRICHQSYQHIEHLNIKYCPKFESN